MTTITQKQTGPCEPSQLAHARAYAIGGSEKVFHHPLVKCFNYTLGVKTTKDMARADWLLDDIALKVVPHLRRRSAGFVGGDVFRVILEVDRWPAPNGPDAVLQVMDRNAISPVGWGSWEIDTCDHPIGSWEFLLGRTMVGQRVVEMLWLPEED